MTLQEYINNLKKYQNKYNDKSVKIKQPNGNFTPPEIKLELHDPFDTLNKTTKNVKSLIIT